MAASRSAPEYPGREPAHEHDAREARRCAAPPVPAPLALRVGSRSSCQVFCFPPAGGSPASYGAWAIHAPEEWSLYATPTPGLVGLSAGGAMDWAGAVSLIADGILAREDGTPKAFFGHFLGAAAAIAVAGELVRRGKPGPALIGVSACPPRGARELFTSFDAVGEDDLLLSLVRLGVMQPAMMSSTALRATASRMFRADMQLAAGADHERLLPLDVPLTAFGGERDRLVRATDMPAWCVKSSNFLGTRIYDAAHAYPTTHASKVVADFAADVRICVQSTRAATRGPGFVPRPGPNFGQPLGPGYSPAGRPVHARTQRPAHDRLPGRASDAAGR